MKKISIAGIDVVLTGGRDRDGGGDGPLVVLLHGFGAPGDDLVSLSRVLTAPNEKAPLRFAFPAAPIAFQMMPGIESRAWWMIDVGRFQRALERNQMDEIVRQIPDGLIEVRTTMDTLLGELSRLLSPSSMVLGGFSQGAMLSLDVALHTEQKLAALILFSGTLIAKDEWLPRFSRLHKTPIFQSHGEQDPILPFSIATELHDEIVRARIDTTWVPFRGGHEIPGRAIDGVTTFLSKVI